MVIAPASISEIKDWQWNKSGNVVTRTDQTNRGDLCIVISRFTHVGSCYKID